MKGKKYGNGMDEEVKMGKGKGERRKEEGEEKGTKQRIKGKD